MYAFEATAEFLNKTNSEIKTQHQAAAKFLSAFAQNQYSALQSGLGQAFQAAEKLPLAEKPLVVQTRSEIKVNIEKAVGVSQAYTLKGLDLFENKVPVVLDKGFSYAALALSQAESLTANALTLSTTALEQAKKNERVKPVIEQAEQIAEQLFSKIGVKAPVAKKATAKKPAAKKATAAKKPAAKKTATRTKKASA